MKLSVHEKAVVGSRWSLFTVVAEDRFHSRSNTKKSKKCTYAAAFIHDFTVSFYHIKKLFKQAFRCD